MSIARQRLLFHLSGTPGGKQLGEHFKDLSGGFVIAMALAINPKPGCRFAPRCPYACERCYEPQQLEEVEPNHFVSCCRVKEIN